MDRFAVIIWEARNPACTETAHALTADLRAADTSWQTVLEGRGLRIMRIASDRSRLQAYLLGENAGVVLGTLFRHDESCEALSSEIALAPAQTKAIVETNGRSLTTDFWGRYVAVIADPDRYRHFVLRDPAGQLPCYHARIGGVHVYISDTRLLTLWSAFTPHFEPAFLIANIMVPELATSRTGLSGVHEHLPGEAHEIGPEGITTHAYWTPACALVAGGLRNTHEAGTILRKTVRRCVTAWLSRYDRAILNLSGGLDSSIVLGCMAASGTPAGLLCLNYRAAERGGDERAFARRSAHDAGCRLIELTMPQASSLEMLTTAHRLTARPRGSIFGYPTKAREQKIAKEHGAEVFLSGEGGDHLFYEMPTPLAAADAMRDHGLNSTTLQAILDNATWTGESVWAILEQALVYGLLRRRWTPEPGWDLRNFPYLATPACELVRSGEFTHPWTVEAASLPSGKAYQIDLLAKVLQRRENSPRSDTADIIHPLLSQPIIEVVLRIPSYVLAKSGESRGLARHAFRNLVPAEILSRRTKGGTTGYFITLMLNNLAAARSFLCGGIMAEQGLVDTERLKDHLTAARLQRPGEIAGMLKLVSTEAWLRAWSRAGGRFS